MLLYIAIASVAPLWSVHVCLSVCTFIHALPWLLFLQSVFA